ncbi:MAG: TIR domain-containing protein [Eubacterium sp.]|nr:TIR domain-containing protein [Eubacterium sp.]
MKDIFISYKSEEIAEAKWVKHQLEAKGFSCWMAPGSIPGGSSYAVEIPAAIRACKVFVLVLSAATQESQWVPKELDTAINHKKKIMPFVLENCELKDEFGFYLSNIQRYPAYEDKEEALAAMVKDISAFIHPVVITPRATEPSAKADASTTSVLSFTASDDPYSAKEEPQPIEEEPAEERSQPTKKKKVKKEKRNKKDENTAADNASLNKKKKRKRGLRIVLGVIIGLLVLVIAIPLIVNAADRVTIAGEKRSRSSHWVALEEVELTEKDVNTLGKMKHLSSVSLNDCQLSATVFTSLMQLQIDSVTVTNCGVTDEWLSNVNLSFSEIGELDLSGNPISDPTFMLPLLDHIYTLKLDNTAITDFSFLSDATSLGTLSLHGDNLTDINFLAGLSSLQTLDLSENNITSLAPLSGLPILSVLNVSQNALTSLEGLEYALELTELYADGNAISSLNGIANCTLLRTVSLNQNQLTKFSELAKSAGTLFDLSVDGNGLQSLEELADCTLLESLSVNNNRLNSLDGIENIIGLTTLSASGNLIDDLSPLQTCHALSTLILSDNSLSETDALFDILNTTDSIYLDLSNNAITDLTLPQVTYSTLAIYGNQIDYSFLSDYDFSSLVADYNEAVDYDAFANKAVNLYLFSIPLDQQKAMETLLDYRLTVLSDDLETASGQLEEVLITGISERSHSDGETR